MNLSPAEMEALAVLGEECGETGKAVGKAQRHGFVGDDRALGGKVYDNRADIELEAGDILAALVLMHENGVIDLANVADNANDKLARIGLRLHHLPTPVLRVAALVLK